MSSRMGRPTDDKKDSGYRLRMSDTDLEKLDYCSKVLGLAKADIIRQGIDEMYKKAKAQNE